MSDSPVKKNRPDERKTITTFDPTISDLEDKDVCIDQYLIPKTPLQLCFLNESIRGSILFANLDETQLNALLKVFDVQSCNENETVFKIGEPANNFYIVNSGQFKSSDEKTENIRDYFKGDLVCEKAMLFQYNHKFNFQAQTFSSLWFVDRQVFRLVKLTLVTRKRKLCETYLADIPIFRQLHSSDFINLADCLETITVKKGEFVYKQQSTSNGLYIVEKGTVHMCSMDDVGKQIVLYAVKKGGHFGERSMITCSPRKTSAIAATDVVVSFLLVAAFERLKGFCKDIAREEDIKDIFGAGADIDIFTQRQF